MFNAPAAVWNEIAATQKLRFPVNFHRFRMTDAQLTETLDAEYDQLLTAGVNRQVAVAYQLARPMLQEREAISRWLELSERGTAPTSLLQPIGSMREAIQLMSSEYNLMGMQQAQLKALLTASFQSPSGLPSSLKQIGIRSSEETMET